MTALCAAAAAWWWPALTVVATETRLRWCVCRARRALNDVHVMPVRVVRTGCRLESFVASVLPRSASHAERLGLAAQIGELAESVHGDTHARAMGIADLLSGKFERAIADFQRVRTPGPMDWNDLAAAHVCAARTNGRPEHWLEALTAIDRALTLDPAMLEALFNRATIVGALGIAPTARVHWARYIELDAASPWQLVAREKTATPFTSDSEAWKTATTHLETLPDADLASLTRRTPQAARRHADVVYLSRWAAARIDRKHEEADAILAKVRIIGRTLAELGDPFIADAVQSIEGAEGDSERLNELIRGQLLYQKGRLKLNEFDPAGAEKEFRAAAPLLAAGGSPMAAMVDFWIASVQTEQQRTDDAHRILVSLLERPEYRKYPSLLGHIHYQLSLLESFRGNWSQALAAASAARDEFASIGERGNVANTNAMLSESYDLLGQPELAREHGLTALGESVADGALDRARAMLAGLCRTELRGGRWARALSLVRLEGELAPLAPDVRMEPDMAIRAAAAEWHLEDGQAASRWLLRARQAATHVQDPTMRAKLLADVDAAEGTILRRHDPRRAMTLLSSAIAFQHRVSRPIALPELYLQRGRASLTMNDLAAAEIDFEAGLVELERQRTRILDTELRPGIFDDATELFDEAISLQIRRGGDVDRVFRYVERGRARAVLEQIHGGDPTLAASRIPRISDVRSKLVADTALIEYVALPERLVVFTIRRERVTMRTTPVSRAALTRAARAFAASRGAEGSLLYDLLIGSAREELQGASALNIVADDALQRVPFAALYDRTRKTFLIQHFALATSPSAGTFLVTQARSQLIPPHAAATALVFANPTIPRQEFGDLPSLVGAEYEAANVARAYSRADVLTGSAATAKQFLRLAPNYDVVQFSGHGLNNEREPYASALVCAATSDHAGGVTAREIARTRFRSTRVVVLAACSTMLGRNAAIEGVPSLSRAFLVAGVPAVIGTLWDIDDRQAAAITRPLHEHLARGAAASDALRMTQLEAIRRRLPPSQWSAFALMGSATSSRIGREP